MKKIAKLEEIYKDRKRSALAYGVATSLYYAYVHTQIVGKELLDFDDEIWPSDVSRIVDGLNEFGIDEFTISCNCLCLIEALATFETFGFKIVGTKTVKGVVGSEIHPVSALHLRRSK